MPEHEQEPRTKGYEELRIAAVKQPTMTRHDRTRIFESRVAFDARFDQVADNAEHATDRTEYERLGDIHLDSGNKREQAPERHGEDKAREKDFPSFLW